MIRRNPGRHGDDVVTGPSLRLGLDGEQQFVALGRDVVDSDFNFLLFPPGLDQLCGGLVGTRNPMVPKGDR